MASSTTNGHHHGDLSTTAHGELHNGSHNGEVSAIAIEDHHTHGHSSTEISHAHSTHSHTDVQTSHFEDHASYTQQTFSSEQQITILRQTIKATRSKLICDLSNIDDEYIDSMTVESFLEYIESERLTNMPQRGSRWDKVLKWAEFFALQISGYQLVLEPFVPQSGDAAQLIYASCRSLIELGPANAQAIETAFAVLYKIGLSLSFFSKNYKLLSHSARTRIQVGEAFNDLLLLVRDIAIHYYVHSNTVVSEVSLDFNHLFGRSIDSFYARKGKIIDGMWSSRIEDDSIDIHAIRKWLSISDTVTRNYLRDLAASKARRDEYTCDWIQRSILDFTRGTDQTMAITGPSGSGKSMLCGWISERLQRPIGGKTFETISLSINIELREQCTSFAIAKNLALQLLTSSIGDIGLLKALNDVYNKSLGWYDQTTLETGLWKAINVGFSKTGEKPIVILIDGLDDRCQPQMTSSLSTQISELNKKHKNVKTIIFARKASQFTNKVHFLPITPDHVHHDLQHIAEHALEVCHHYRDQNEHERENIAGKLVTASKGNFLWIQLMAKFLKHEPSHEAFTKAVKSAQEAPKSVEQLIKDLISLVTADYTKTDSLHLITWLVVAERPLTVDEIKGLFRVDIQKKILTPRRVDSEDEIKALGGSLIRIQNGIVRFRNGAIRELLVKLSSEGKLRSLTTIQSDFTQILVAYCKFRLTSPFVLSFDPPSGGDSLFLHDALLEYASKRWITHFKQSTLFKSTGQLGLSAEFKALFPSTAQLSTIEWASWTATRSNYDAMQLLDLALRIRQESFSEKHEAVVQNLIACGHGYRKLSRTEEAIKYFYRASHIAQTVLRSYSTITVSCTTAFLELTESFKFTSRTHIVDYREELLRYIVSVYTHQHGRTSDLVIKYHKILAELYVSIHEHEKAEACWKELREIIIIRYGEGSSEEAAICGHLQIVIKRDDTTDIVEYEEDIFGTTCEMEVWDIRRIEIIIKMAIRYESHGHLLKAEECYVLLWSGLIERCQQIDRHYHFEIDIYITMINVTLDYIRFLHRHHRHEEASAILICIWAEYEEYEFESEIIFLRLKIIGEFMRTVGLFSLAVSVFRKCLAWFQFHEKYDLIEECQTFISETIEEITTIETKTTTTTTTTTTTETVIKEIFESSVTKTVVSKETISIFQSFIALHMKSEQWEEAISAATRSLTLIWKILISGKGVITLPRDFSIEAIEIAINLAICHHHANHFHEAEELYLRIYHACFRSCGFNDEHFVRSYKCVIKFYEAHSHWHKVIHIYQELLEACRKQMGASHALTIKFMYELAALCTAHGHAGASEYYEQIIVILNGSSTVCHHDAFHAMEILCRVYYEQGHWRKLKSTCEILWGSWTSHHKHRFDATFIELLYSRYIYVLERHFHVEYELIRRLTLEYRDTCVLVYGATSYITLKALIALANICLRSEKHTHEAISFYEEVIKITTTTTTTTISTSTLTTVKEKLSKAYIHVCSTDTVSTHTTERAILILTERFEFLKIKFGCAHVETLIVLQELIRLQLRLKTKESTTIIIKTLLENTVLIISKESHSRVLFEAAKTLASIYRNCGLIEEGRKLLRELHIQIVFGTRKQQPTCGFKIDPTVGRSSYVFLVTFEETLYGSISVNYSKIMAELLTETILFESWTRCVKSEKDINIILSAGAKLFVFLEKASRKEQVIILQEEIHHIFIKQWGSIVKARHEISLVFLTSLLRTLGSQSQKIKIGDAACRSTNSIVSTLIRNDEFQKAYEVSFYGFHFGKHHKSYHQLSNIGYGFKLSSMMATHIKNAEKQENAELQAKMLDLSREIITVVLKACRDSKINIVRLKLTELNDLVHLLGDQKNYTDLEWILTSLWSSREVQKQWSPPTIVALAKLLIQTRFLLGQHSSAVTLGEAICYNLRRVYGALDPKALEVSDLLSQIYIAAGHFNEAMRLHEEILRLVVEGDDSDDSTIDTVTPKRALQEINMLKQCFLRLRGWDKKQQVYKDLVDKTLAMPVYKKDALFKNFKGFDTWSLKETPEGSREFKPNTDWRLVDENAGSLPMCSDPRKTLKRITSNWGVDLGVLHFGSGGGESHSAHSSPRPPHGKPEILYRMKEVALPS